MVFDIRSLSGLIFGLLLPAKAGSHLLQRAPIIKMYGFPVKQQALELRESMTKTMITFLLMLHIIQVASGFDGKNRIR
jgi:hypothetical protein